MFTVFSREKHLVLDNIQHTQQTVLKARLNMRSDVRYKRLWLVQNEYSFYDDRFFSFEPSATGAFLSTDQDVPAATKDKE